MVTVRRPHAAPLVLLGLGIALSACVTPSQSSTRDRFLAALDSMGYDTARTSAPRVSVSTEAERLQTRRIIPRIHVADDAYVAVVNVWPSGVASVIYPESPDDDGFLPGGRTYVMSSVFSGFATMFPPTGAQGLRYARFGRSSDSPVGVRGPGYLVLVASRTPLDLTALDTAGLFDEVHLGTNVHAMEPSTVAPWIALLASGGNPSIMIDHARYGGYDAMSMIGSPVASSFSSRYCGFGYFDAPVSYPWEVDYDPACNARARRDGGTLRWSPPFRPLRPPLLPRDSTRPPADTLHTPTSRSAEVRAAWSALLRQTEARRAGYQPSADDAVELPRSRDRQALDDDVMERSRRTGRPGDDRTGVGYRGEARPERTRPREPVGDRRPPERPRAEPAPPRAESAPPRSDPAPRRTEPAQPRAEPAPRREDPAPRPQPAERPARGPQG